MTREPPYTLDILRLAASLQVRPHVEPRPLAEAVCEELGTRLGKALVGTFSDGEVQVEIEENVRRQEVFVIQPTCAPSAQRASTSAPSTTTIPDSAETGSSTRCRSRPGTRAGTGACSPTA